MYQKTIFHFGAKPDFMSTVHCSFRVLHQKLVYVLPLSYYGINGAARMHVDQFTLQHWMEKDATFKEGLEIVKRTYENNVWPEEEKTDAMGTAELAFGITLVLEETKKNTASDLRVKPTFL